MHASLVPMLMIFFYILGKVWCKVLQAPTVQAPPPTTTPQCKVVLLCTVSQITPPPLVFFLKKRGICIAMSCAIFFCDALACVMLHESWVLCCVTKRPNQ